MFKFSQEEKIVILVLVGIIGLGGIFYYFYNSKEFSLEKIDEIQEGEKLKNKSQTQGEIIVHISGAVRNPGIYKLKKDSRVFEAINAAGGYSTEADIDKINLVATIKDGEKIHIPYKVQTLSSNLININTATESELCSLPGIGPSLAKRIIEYRTSHYFSSIEEIKNVKGIGEKKFEKIKNLITVN
jgi:competence protein ComEA